MPAKLNSLARDPQAVDLFRRRVDRHEWTAARRLALALGLHRSWPPVIGETAPEYLARLAEQFANVA